MRCLARVTARQAASVSGAGLVMAKSKQYRMDHVGLFRVAKLQKWEVILDKRQTSWTPKRREAHSIAMRKMWAEKQKAAVKQVAKPPETNWLQQIWRKVKGAH